jgi:hypothetical protein
MSGYLERVRGTLAINTYHVDRCPVSGREIRVPVTVDTLERALTYGLPVVEVRP